MMAFFLNKSNRTKHYKLFAKQAATSKDLLPLQILLNAYKLSSNSQESGDALCGEQALALYLYLALCNKKENVVEMLLMQGATANIAAQPDENADNRLFPLEASLNYSHSFYIVDLILDAGADPNKAATPNSQLPLITAIKKENQASRNRNSWLFPNPAFPGGVKKDYVSLLIFYGANIAILKDQTSASYSFLFLSYGGETLMDRLIKREKQINQEKVTVCQYFAEACKLPVDIGNIFAEFFNHRTLEQVKLTCKHTAGKLA